MCLQEFQNIPTLIGVDDYLATCNRPHVNAYTLHLIALVAIGLTTGLSAQKTSSIQSAARPFGLDIAGKVMLASSDTASRTFQKTTLPELLQLSELNLAEYKKLGSNATNANFLNPSKLQLGADTMARAYFVGEGADYSNSLGISTTESGPDSKDAELIFPNASTPDADRKGKYTRSKSQPLLPGDFVDLGTFKKGTFLDFFLIADGANGGEDFFTTNKSANSDGLAHAVSFVPNGSPYLIIGFEDIWGGGDGDYNDLIFAVFVGESNAKYFASLGNPEPTLAAGSLLALGMIFGRKRRN
jgi:Domain of unknown function (DUF4114)